MGLFGGTAGNARSTPGGAGGGGGAPHVLVVAPDAGRRAGLDKALKQDHLSCELADSPAAAISMLARCEKAKRQAEEFFQAAVIDAEACTPATIKLIRELGTRHIAAVVLCPHVTFDEAVAAMRAGAADIVSADIKPRELAKRIRAACKHAGLPPARAESAAAHKGLKATKLGSPPDLASLEADYRRTIDAELDVEAILRHTLEFVLAKLGPTNAAIFLPGSTGDYQLGAYVNFSCPKDTAEVMLDHLANIAAPRLEKSIGVLALPDARAIQEAVGEGVEWLGNQHALAFACRQEDETLAVFMIFRDRATPFADHAHSLLDMIREQFGRQLAKVIRIHHRHLPRDKWGRVGDGLTSEEDDLAA